MNACCAAALACAAAGITVPQGFTKTTLQKDVLSKFCLQGHTLAHTLMVANTGVKVVVQQVKQVHKLDAHGSVPYVGESLTRLREEVGNESAVLGFVGAPFTLATYVVEGGSSKNFAITKRLMFTQPDVMHAFLSKMADNIADYVRYQVCTAAVIMCCQTRKC